ncbi:hypothetical protein [Legionella tunisiensis]|uniref:hypothetical protein n=1 Tax=Legionella tunisiensis TaxID=1034944 RepID=UPI0003137C63|nr:hypothetical protein [Legionella tunisiensis]
MPKLNKGKANTLKLIVLDYLQGESLNNTRERLKNECLELNYPCHDLFQFIVLEVKDRNDPLLLAILDSLDVNNAPEESYEKLFANSKNLYELLTHLYHDGHHHLGYLLKLIDKTKPSYLWTLIAGAISSIGLGSWAYNRGAGRAILIWIERSAPPFIHWFSKTISILRNIPLLGVMYNSLTLGWIWQSTLAYGTTTNPRKVYYLFFETLAKTLTIIAYLLALMAIGHMTIIPTCLFIGSSCVDVIKSFCSIFINYKQKKMISSLDAPDTWAKKAQQIRSINLIERSSETVWVKLLAAGSTTITVAFMCIVPPNLLLSASCLLVMALIFLAKHSLLAGVHELFAVKLQLSISEIAPPPVDEPGLRPLVIIEEGPAFEDEPAPIKQIVLSLVDGVANVADKVVNGSPTTILRNLGGRKFPQNGAFQVPQSGIDDQPHHPSPLLKVPPEQSGGEVISENTGPRFDNSD